MEQKFSVLMSLYIKEKPEYFCECMDSILNQTVKPDEIVIVKDGPLTDRLEAALLEYISRSPELYTVVPLEKNVGLGGALREGMLHTKNELVARMDTDDIARSDRFERQLREFRMDEELDICGGQVDEFEGNAENIVAVRRVPISNSDIKKYQKRRDAFNHMTVMFKKSAVLRAGNYQPCPLMEDTILWVNMILSGAKCKNIDESLVYARVDGGMFGRRGGFEYFKKYREGRRRVRETGYIGFFDYYSTLAVQLAVALMPNRLRQWAFKRFLHGRPADRKGEARK